MDLDFSFVLTAVCLFETAVFGPSLSDNVVDLLISDHHMPHIVGAVPQIDSPEHQPSP